MLHWSTFDLTSLQLYLYFFLSTSSLFVFVPIHIHYSFDIRLLLLQSGSEINNVDNIYSGKPGIAYMLLKNRSYFLQNEEFMRRLTEECHFKNIDDAVWQFYIGSISWGQTRKDRSSLMTGE